jgi:hypothetical protein
VIFLVAKRRDQLARSFSISEPLENATSTRFLFFFRGGKMGTFAFSKRARGAAIVAENYGDESEVG